MYIFKPNCITVFKKETNVTLFFINERTNYCGFFFFCFNLIFNFLIQVKLQKRLFIWIILFIASETLVKSYWIKIQITRTTRNNTSWHYVTIKKNRLVTKLLYVLKNLSIQNSK